MIVLWLVILLLLPGQSFATIYWDDELESGNTGYTLPGDGSMTFDTSFKFSGSGSLRLDYTSECYPDHIIDQGFQCGGFMDRAFTATGTLFRRFYLYLPSSFTIGDTETKMLTTLPTGSTTYDVVWEFQFGDHTMTAAIVRSLDGQVEQHTTATNIATDQWVCVETQETLNTIGSANGIVRLWYDGVQVLNVTNATFLVSGDTNGHNFETHRFFRQVGLGSLWFDKFAVGNTRFNDCAAGGGGSAAGGGLDF
jgi:hypothetical protein